MRELPEGLVWRKREDGSTFESIYFKKQYRGRRIRGASGTSDPEEAARRLRKRLDEIDNIDLYGKRRDFTFNEGAAKLLEEFQGSPKTLRIYAQQADILSPWIGSEYLKLICKDRLRPFIDSRRKDGVSVRTINMSMEFVRLVLRKAAHYWREDGMSWIENCPIISFEKGSKAKPYPISWAEQARFFDLLPGTEREIALFCVNTGLRDSVLCGLDWAWERHEEAINESVFVIPSETIGLKGRPPMILVLNRIARQVLESRRGKHDKYVFGEVKNLTNSAWKKAWKLAGLPTGKEFRKGVHNLRHTFGKRLRDAGVDERDVQDLLHHVPKSITRHYSAPEVRKLRQEAEKVVPSVRLAVAG
jgi:integrase